MSRQTLKYKCETCGYTYEYKLGEQSQPLIDHIWNTHHKWAVWAICSDCMETNESNLMWPTDVKGPDRTMTCDQCDFEVEYPEALLNQDDSFKCPDCGSGTVS